MLQTNELNRINVAIQQFEGRMASLNAQLNILWDEAIATDHELNLFLKKLETNNVKQFLDVDIIRLNSQVYMNLLFTFSLKQNNKSV